MDDLISRQAAINAILHYTIRIPGYMSNWGRKLTAAIKEDLIEEIDAIPTAQQWIPVSERLPHLWNERYLVSLAWGGIGVMEYKSTGFHNYGSFTPVPIESIIAWMPLPEPYKGGV